VVLSLTAVRGLLHRSRATIMIFILTVVGTAAAAAGPAYYQAARTSILHDALATSNFEGRGFEAAESGPVGGMLTGTSSLVNSRLAVFLGPARGQHLFAPQIDSIEATVGVSPYGAMPLVYRTDFCAHLRIQGACPTKKGQIIVSAALAKATHWHIGQQLTVANWPTFTITGTYAIPNLGQIYWSTRGQVYFPAGSLQNVQDAFFSPRATLDGAAAGQQGTVIVDQMVNTDSVTTGSVGALQKAMTDLTLDPVLGSSQVIVTSALPGTLGGAESAWHSVAVPVALITAQLLALCLLLLFTAVTEAVDGRGADIALARLRGQGRIRTLGFGLSEPVLVLLAALPVGVVAGWSTARALSGARLRPGTPVILPDLAWIVAAAVVVAGFAAVLQAAFRAVRRPVTEQWRRTGPQATRRGWIVDAVLATAAVAALADLVRGGETSQGSGSTLGLLVPGLLGLAVAVVASRVLPVLCQSGFRVTQRRGGLSIYLALRHIARRPGGIRTTIVLATAFTLATYAIGAWFVGRNNEDMVAGRRVGAPAVLTVNVPVGKDLAAVVDKADPSGRLAVPVLRYTDEISADPLHTLLAVDPARFARIAAATPGFRPTPAGLTSVLAPPAPPAVQLNGDALRVTVRVDSLSLPGLLLTADVDAQGATPVTLGNLPSRGTATFTGDLVNCPCVLQDLDISASSANNPTLAPVSGTVTVTGIQVRHNGQWTDLAPGLLTSVARWAANSGGPKPAKVTAGPAGLTWQFHSAKLSDSLLAAVNRPSMLPVVLSTGAEQPGTSIIRASGLDGNQATFKVAAEAATLPSITSAGGIVDLRYAELAAAFNYPQVDEQVWLADGAQPLIEKRLKAQGVQILSAESTASVSAFLGRQGPGLGNILFLADAAAAVLLASGTAVLGLYVSARRRRYEYAALEASGVARRALRRSLLLEIAVVSIFGSIVGIGAGIGSLAIAIRGVPEFVRSPGVPLNYHPPGQQLAIWLGSAVVLLLIAACAAAITLIRGIRSEQLRESA
jgi:putative ABC transport system permease protein